MNTKMNNLKENSKKLSEAEFLLLFNKWDVEYTQLITAAESKCRKYKNDHIPFLPGIGVLIQRINTYNWIQRYKSGKRCNVGNLERACRCLCINGLSQISLDQAQLEEFACTEELKGKQDQAPKLRLEHLQDRLDKTKARKDEDAVKAITRTQTRIRQEILWSNVCCIWKDLYSPSCSNC